MTTVGIIDYGVGNIASIQNALNFIGVTSELFERPEDFSKYGKIILPGVGAFGEAMASLHSKELIKPIQAYSQKPENKILGICLGMQLLLERSYEYGMHDGLGLIKGEVLPLSDIAQSYAIPNIGWCKTVSVKDSGITAGLNEAEDFMFYYVHSFFCRVDDPKNTVAQLAFDQPADVIIEQGNVFGCQFHPEKSQKPGLKILENFAEL